jgi:Spx/MgsR family transcriptional regulator
MAITLYGIPNCDTVKKARAWLAGQGVEHAFHDFKKQGVPPGHLDRWLGAAGWEKLLNRRGTTWRKFDESTQLRAGNEAGARALMLSQPSVHQAAGGGVGGRPGDRRVRPRRLELRKNA